ncbi:unnamed protein product [Orchesella dallaii]|uniref:Uncharacterized protein n=1 Tax=Orchesella dallaii TaxID=48710 RepID=A0ABP1R9R6_9HEXA
MGSKTKTTVSTTPLSRRRRDDAKKGKRRKEYLATTMFIKRRRERLFQNQQRKLRELKRLIIEFEKIKLRVNAISRKVNEGPPKSDSNE